MGFGDHVMLSGEFVKFRADFPQIRVNILPSVREAGTWKQVFMNNPHLARHDNPNGNWVGVLDLSAIGPRICKPHKDRLEWRMDFSPTPGEIYFTDEEKLLADRIRSSTSKPKILIQPFAKSEQKGTDGKVRYKQYMKNKEWPLEYFMDVMNEFRNDVVFIQARPDREGLSFPDVEGAVNITENRYRRGAAILSGCDYYLGLEGGMHHAAAALNIPGTVIFGNWVSPKTTGYAIHKNHYVGDLMKPCCALQECSDCARALEQIKPEFVKSDIKLFLDNYHSVG